MSIRGLVRLLLAPWPMSLSVVDHAVNQVRDFWYWMILRKPSKRSVILLICVPVAYIFVSCLALKFVCDSKQVQKYAKNMFIRHNVGETDRRLELDKEPTVSIYHRYAGEDVSFRCVIPLRGLDPNHEILWIHEQDNVWQLVPSKNRHEPVYDSVGGNVHTQLDLINIDKKDFNTTYTCIVYYYYYRTPPIELKASFMVRKIIDRVHYIYEPAGSLVQLKPLFISVESTKYKPPSAGYEINGVDFRQFKNKANRCSPFLMVAMIYAVPPWTYRDLERAVSGYYTDTDSIMKVDEITVLRQPNREPLLDFNRQTKTWITAKFCMDDHFHGVLQFYFNRTRYNDILGEYETLKFYYPITWILNPNGVNNLLNPADSLGKEGQVRRYQYDPNYTNFMKNKLRMMQSDDGFNIGVETKINFESAVIMVSVFIVFDVIIPYLSVRSILAIERFFIYARLLTSKCPDRANDDRKDVYIFCSEAGLEWTYNHVLSPLEKRGITAWIPQRDVLPGCLKLDGTLAGVEQCRKIIIVLTPDLAVQGLDNFLLKNLMIMLAKSCVSTDNVLIINKNGAQEQIEIFQVLLGSFVISSLCLTEMTDQCLSSIHTWIKRM